MSKANKTDKISVSALDKVVKETYTPFVEIDWNGNRLIVKRTLSLRDMVLFVDSVVKSCFSADTHDFIPEAKDFAVRSNIVDHYTNVTMPKNLDHMYNLLYQTDLARVVLDNIDEWQFREMISAINNKIRHISSSDTARIVEQMNQAVAVVNDIAENIGELFSGVSRDDLTTLTDAVANGSIDEGKIVRLIANKDKAD